MTTYQFWQHKRSGETYAIRIEDDKVTGCCGPLTDSGDWDELENYHYGDTPEDADWADAIQDEFRLVERGKEAMEPFEDR